MRRLGAAVVVVATLALAGCTGAGGPSAETPSPSVGATSTGPAQNASKPLGSWDLSPGIPEHTPVDLPFPRDRWIEDSSAPFDAEGGMIDFWVTPTEFEQILLDFETAGWDLGDREETPGRINVIGYADDQTRAVNIVFVEETKDRDSRLTVTYVASV